MCKEHMHRWQLLIGKSGSYLYSNNGQRWWGDEGPFWGEERQVSVESTGWEAGHAQGKQPTVVCWGEQFTLSVSDMITYIICRERLRILVMRTANSVTPKKSKKRTIGIYLAHLSEKEVDNCDIFGAFTIDHLWSELAQEGQNLDHLNSLPCDKCGSLFLTAVIIQVLFSVLSHWFNLVRLSNWGWNLLKSEFCLYENCLKCDNEQRYKANVCSQELNICSSSLGYV